MRILHTSDWHLGVEYFHKSRRAEHEAFLAWLLDCADEHAVDAVVVAGDIFDTGSPPAEALAAYYGFLAELSRRGRQAIIVGGNHDAPSRLDAPVDVLRVLAAEVVGGFQPGRGGPLATEAGVIVPVRRRAEVVGAVAAVPYLHDWKLGVRGSGAEPGALLGALHEAFSKVYRELADLARAEFPDLPLLGTGHLTCLPNAGAKPSEADAIPVEINHVGSLGAMGPEIFDPRFDYVALGHIHRGMVVERSGRVRYSGTPVQVGGKEAVRREVLLVELKAGGERAVTSIAAPVTRRLVTVRGEVDEVVAGLGALTWGEGELPPYVVADATVGADVLQARTAMRDALPEGPGGRAILVNIAMTVTTQNYERSMRDHELLLESKLTPEAVFAFAWGLKYGGAAVPPAILERFASLHEQE